MRREFEFAPLGYLEGGYLPLEDYGLIGDGASAALIGRDGSVGWLCAPRFDAPPLFCPLLDPQAGGVFRLAPVGCSEGRQFYLDDTGVLITELRGTSGAVWIADCLPLQPDCDLRPATCAGHGGLLRRVEALTGPVRLQLELAPRAEAAGAPFHWRADGHDVVLLADANLTGTRTTLTVTPERPLHLFLGWNGISRPFAEPEAVLADTVAAWQRWLRHFSYEGPLRDHVQRSAITLKMLDYWRPAPSSPPPHPRCPRASAASATGITASPGCAMRHVRCMPCAASAWSTKPSTSSAGCWKTWSATRADARTCCMAWTARHRRRSGKTGT